jgi:hypothetical protein
MPEQPLSIASSDWAMVTSGGLVVQGPSHRSMLRTLAPSTPPLLRTDTPSVKTRSLTRPSPLSDSGPISPTGEGPALARASRRPNIDIGARQGLSDGSIDACTTSELLSEASEWAVPTLGGLQITGPSRRWMMRQSAPSTPTLMRPSTANPALQGTRDGRASRSPYGTGDSVSMLAFMHGRFRLALNRLNVIVNDGAEDEEPLVEQGASADELVLQLEMLVDQLEGHVLRYHDSAHSSHRAG